MSDPIIIQDAPATTLAEAEAAAITVLADSQDVVIVVEDAPTVIVRDPTSAVLALVTAGPAGPRGPVGPQGASGGSYTFDQLVPAVNWTIPHPLGKRPSVSVQDSAGRLVVGDVQYLGDGLVIVSFTAAFSGRADLN